MEKRITLPLFRIWSVALYEAKMTVRSMIYKVFLVFIAVPGVLFSIMICRLHNYIAIPAYFPHLMLTMIIPVCAAFGFFMAEESLARERREDSAGMFHARPVSNMEFLFGKALGVCMAMALGTSAALLLFAVIGTISSGLPITLAGYVYIPLLVCCPMFPAIVGMTFFCALLIRSRAVSLTVLVAVFWWVTFSLGSAWDNLFDYAALRVPLLYSDFVGFGNLPLILAQRAMWLLAGLAFVFLAALVYERTPNSRRERLAARSLCTLCLAGAAGFGSVYLSDFRAGREMRGGMLALSRDVAGKPRVTVTGCRIDLCHRGSRIDAAASFRFENRTKKPLGRYAFSLNPGLRVLSVSSGGANVRFDRALHIITITPETPLAPDACDSVIVRYRGSIEEKACYHDIDERARKNGEPFIRLADKRYGFITPRSVLLTPECLWYPTAGAPYGSVFPGTLVRDFTRFMLRVETDPKLTAVSQGAAVRKEGVWTFSPECPIPQISLAIGEYEKKAVTVDGVEYAVYVKRGHDHFTPYLSNLRGELPSLVRDFREYYEGYTGRSYPFRRFALVETPAHFFALRRFWSPYLESVQPEMVLLPEMGTGMSGVDFWNKKGNYSVPEIEASIFKKFIGTNLLSRIPNRAFFENYERMFAKPGWSLVTVRELSQSNNLNVFPDFYRFTNAVSSVKTPLLDSALESYLYGNTPSINPPHYDFEAVTTILDGRSPGEAFSDPLLRECGPEILMCVASILFNKLGADATKRQLDAFLWEFLDASRGRVVPAESLFTAFRVRFGRDMEEAAGSVLAGKGLPACVATDARYQEIPGTDGPWFQVRFTAYNPNPVEGTFAAGVSLESNDRSEPGLVQREKNHLTRYFTLPGGATKEVGFIVDKPFYSLLTVETLLSENRPNTYYLPIGKIPPEPGFTPFDGARTLDRPPSLAAPGEIVVDNEDPGFEVLSNPRRSVLARLLHSAPSDNDDIREDSWWIRPPSNWRPVIDGRFYGYVRKSVHVIKAGKGKNRVRWTAEIPEDCGYEVFFHSPDIKKGFLLPNGRVFAKDFHFIVTASGGAEEREVNMRQQEEGWILLGTYRLGKGPSSVELTDETKGEEVFADAVKWVKR